MRERSFESEWLVYRLVNDRANRVYRARMQRLHLAYVDRVAVEVNNKVVRARERQS